MNKKRITFLTVIVTVLMVLSLSIFVACDKNSSTTTVTETIKPTEGLIIPNGDFKVTGSSVAYPRTLTNWTGARMYSSGTYASDVVAGAISLEQSSYNAYKSKWNDSLTSDLYDALKTHYSSDKDAINNILGIYMPEKDTNLGNSNAKYGPTAFSYTSSSFTLEKNSYYEVSVDVLTKDIAGNTEVKEASDRKPGANIYISSSTYQEFKQINTNGAWKTYKFYIETAPTTTTSLTLRLSLGSADAQDSKTGLTTGYAFFDNVSATKLTDIEAGDTARQQYLKQVKNEETGDSSVKPFVKTATLKVPNGHFDFAGSSVSSTSAPYGWSVVTGNSDKSDTAPSASYARHGVIDPTLISQNYESYGTTIFTKTSASACSSLATGNILNNADFLSNIKDISKGYSALGNDNKIYMLSQQYMTAQGAKSASAITFEKNKQYKLSISLYTYNIYGDGVSLVLSGSDGKDIIINGIARNKEDRKAVIESDPYKNIRVGQNGATSGQWTTYDFYVKGNQYKDFSYYLTLWLGTGGTNDNTKITYTKYSSTGNTTGSTEYTYDANGTFSTGWVFFDDIKLSEYGDQGITWAPGALNAEQKVDVNGTSTTSINVDLATANKFDGVIDTSTPIGEIGNVGNKYHVYNGISKGWNAIVSTESDAAYISNNILKVGTMPIGTTADYSSYNPKPNVFNPGMPYDIQNKNALMISFSDNVPSTFGFTSNSFTIEKNSFSRISLWVKTQFVSSSTGIYVYLMDDKGTPSDKKDDEAIISYEKINTNDLDENNGWRELTFMVRGNNEKANQVYFKYTLGTGNNATASTLTKGSAFLTNMSWSEISYKNFKDTATGTYVKSKDYSSTPVAASFTNGRFDNYDQTDENLYNGTADNTTRIPSNFSPSVKNEETNLVAGIIGLDKDSTFSDNLHFKASAQTTNLFGASNTAQFNTLYNKTGDYLETPERIGGKHLLAIGSKNTDKFAYGYTSDSFTLNKETKYKLSVWIKTLNGAKATVSLSGEANSVGATAYVIDSAEWTNYTFFVEVGLYNVSLKLNLWLGDKAAYEADENKVEGKSSGIALFDTIRLESLKPDYVYPGDSDVTKKITFTSDGFNTESTSSTALISASNWSGAADTNQSKANTKAGIVDISAPSTAGDGTHVDFLGNADLKRENVVKPTTDELNKEFKDFGILKNNTTGKYDVTGTKYDVEPFKSYTGSEKDERIKEDLLELLIDIKFAAEKQLALIVPEDLKHTTAGIVNGNQFLVINNIKDSAYTYSSSNYSFTANTCYKISVDVRTFNVATNKGAYIELYLGSANETSKPFIFKAINTNGEWTTYDFYISVLSDNVSSAKLKLGLGKYYSADDDTLASGYAFFDNVSFEKVSITDFESAKAGDEANEKLLTREITEEATEGTPSNPPETQNPGNSFNMEYLWWMIPTILLALLTIIVVIVFAVRKIKRPKKASINSEIVKTNENIEEKKQNYDDNRE